MTSYTVPRRDMEFILEEVLDTSAHFQKIIGGEEVNMELVNQILDAGAAICEDVLVPLNEVGDQQGCKIGENGVETVQRYVEPFLGYEQYFVSKEGDDINDHLHVTSGGLVGWDQSMIVSSILSS